MNIKRLFLVILIFLMACHNSGLCEEESTSPANENGTATEVKPDENLEINKYALLEGQNEEIHLKAANVMLYSENPQAREILIETLSNTENSAARMAICKALIQTNSNNSPINNIDEFIQPLLCVLSTENTAEAQLAAETTLIFSYDKIKESIESLATDQSKPVKTRLNAIYALKLRSDMMATIKLIELVDDSSGQVALEAESTLQSLGISVGKDPNTRKQEIDMIIKQGKEAFLQSRLINQNVQMSVIKTQLDVWQKRYLSELDRRYKSIEQDKIKGEFLANYLNDNEPTVRKWALDRAFEWRMAAGQPNLPAELGPIFFGLISDSDRNIRLKTAELLAVTLELKSAQPLLAQLKVEKNEQIKMKLLDALGGACSNALPNPPEPISPELIEIRKETLQFAAQYLTANNDEKTRIGAEVIKKLLKRDGLKQEELDEYLGLLTKRYSMDNSESNGNLRGQLINAMAVLCAQDSSCRTRAGEIFGPIFSKEALQDENNFVRETAVDGLIYIDKSEALKMLRNDFVNDPSEKIRKTIIALADEVGGNEDLNWLAEKIGLNSEGEPAWQAMLNIFKGSNAETIKLWKDKLIPQNSRIKLTDDRKITFLKIAESKVKNNEYKIMIRRKLADLYIKTGDFERSADYYRGVYEATKESGLKDEILPDMIFSYLRIKQIKPVVDIIKNHLTENDLDPNGVIIKSIDKYLEDPGTGIDPNDIYKAFNEIELANDRPVWKNWLDEWYARMRAAKEIDEKQNTVN